VSFEIADIRAGLAANLATVAESRQVSAYRMASPTPPSLVVVGFEEITPITFGRGGFEIPMLIQGLAGKSTDKGAQIRLDKWLSPNGDLNVWAAIESDQSLGGTVSAVTVLRCDGSQFIQLENGTEVLGSTWHVRIDL
jgi:hypothetical protein